MQDKEYLKDKEDMEDNDKEDRGNMMEFTTV